MLPSWKSLELQTSGSIFRQAVEGAGVKEEERNTEITIISHWMSRKAWRNKRKLQNQQKNQAQFQPCYILPERFSAVRNRINK